MHGVFQFLLFWSGAFVTLCMAVALVNIYADLIQSDLTLNSLGQELVLAAIASFLEAGSLWVVVTFIPLAGRALILPAVAVGLLYRLAHAESWNVYDIILLLTSQLVIGGAGAALIRGHFLMAFGLLAVMAIVLGLLAILIRELSN